MVLVCGYLLLLCASVGVCERLKWALPLENTEKCKRF